VSFNNFQDWWHGNWGCDGQSSNSDERFHDWMFADSPQRLLDGSLHWRTSKVSQWSKLLPLKVIHLKGNRSLSQTKGWGQRSSTDGSRPGNGSWTYFSTFNSLLKSLKLAKKSQLWIVEFLLPKIRVAEQFGLRNAGLEGLVSHIIWMAL